MDSITFEIPKSQLAMLAKNSATIVDQGDSSYLMNVVTLSTLALGDSGVYKNNLNWEVNPSYLLNTPTPGDNEADPNPSTFPSSIFPASPM